MEEAKNLRLIIFPLGDLKQTWCDRGIAPELYGYTCGVFVLNSIKGINSLKKCKHSQSGMVLVTALLYLVVLTLLVTIALSTSILQSKVSQHMRQHVQSFSYAELALKTGERAILSYEREGQGDSIQGHYQFQRIDVPESECGLWYEIKATANVGGSSTALTSVFTLPLAGDHPCPDLTLKNHRVSWSEL